MSRPEGPDVGLGASRTPVMRPSYMTATRSVSGQDLVQVLADEQDRRTGCAPLEQKPVDRLHGAHVEAPGRLDGDHEARARD